MLYPPLPLDLSTLTLNLQDLLLYLLQLVQALKFERITDNGPISYDSSLAQFLIDRAIRNPILGNYFHW